MQKSVEGLLRGILHSALLGLSQCGLSKTAGAIEHICGPRWQSAAASGVWSRKELKQMLIRLNSVPKAKSFFLIDGLDECEPQDRLGDLANVVLWMSHMPNVKLCVSCRPWDVFNRKFKTGIFLRLDRLTRHDMEIYIEARLTAAEEERGWEFEFRDGSSTAKQLIRSVARSAEGVFLWTELVVKAMCSEIRKGSKVERLSQIISDFPTDLDEYFYLLIFNRIGRSRQNVADTAAALKLALVIFASTQSNESASNPSFHPFEDSFMNFWLLYKDHLGPGFSWKDSEHILQPSDLQMLDQTTGYLEETCKDLLVLDSNTKSVDFLHRTVFDFLSNNKVHDELEQNAPGHLSAEDFVFNLAKLRCVCLLQAEHEDSHSLVSTIEIILQCYHHLTHMDQHKTWIARLESVTVSKLQEYKLYHDSSLNRENMMLKQSSRCVKAGLSKFLLEFYRYTPTGALMIDDWKNDDGLDFLGSLLQAFNQSDIREPDPWLLQQVLEMGCDPNRVIGKWPYRLDQSYPFNEVGGGVNRERDLMPEWCVRTNWTAWLGGAYTQIVDTGVDSEMRNGRGRQTAGIIGLLLQYGADPHCLICVTDHWKCLDLDCERIVLDQLVRNIVQFLPTESVTTLRNLRDICANHKISLILRKNQRKRAVRSFLVSEGSLTPPPFTPSGLHGALNNPLMLAPLLKIETLAFLENVANLKHVKCDVCVVRDCVLATWCLDCQSMSSLCYYCSLPTPFEAPTRRCSSGVDTDKYGKSPHDHTSVVLIWDDPRHSRKDRAEADYIHQLASRHTTAKTISVMKEWYTKSPIEAGLSFRDVVRRVSVDSFQKPHQMQEPSSTADEVSMEQGGRSNRPWLL
jgi:hypothetical protein